MLLGKSGAGGGRAAVSIPSSESRERRENSTAEEKKGEKKGTGLSNTRTIGSSILLTEKGV